MPERPLAFIRGTAQHEIKKKSDSFFLEKGNKTKSIYGGLKPLNEDKTLGYVLNLSRMRKL